MKAKNSKSDKTLKIASAQINVTLGDFKANSEKILDFINRAVEKKTNLVVFPENALFGYHPFDLLERKKVVEEQLKALKIIVNKMPKGIYALVGHISFNPKKKGRPYFNSSSLISRGRVIKTFHKELLPTGDVFDEARFIESGRTRDNFFELNGFKILVTICEDMWAWPDSKGCSFYKENPLIHLAKSKVDLVINQSASPFFLDKLNTRKSLAHQSARLFKAPFIYTNLVGAQDEIVFDGGSFVVDSRGKTLMQSLQFQEDLNYFDLRRREGGLRELNSNTDESIRQALVLGLRDFCKKIGISKLHLGLSGGIDSAVVACLAVDAIGPENVTLIYLPTEFSSSLSLKLARNLALNLKARFIEFPIQDIYKTMEKEINRSFKIDAFGLTHENLQARIRGTILMSFSNSNSSMLLNTANKSEFAAGYSTLYGDMCGGLCPIGDLTKGQVYSLAKLYNEQIEIIPSETLSRPPSAELRPGQKDSDSLPPYDELDKSVTRIVENSAEVKTATDRWLVGALYKTEFKRWQAPPILKVSKHSFGRGRRYPIAHRAKA
jgi:NAD+ synthase (glutamine-hydrolysing)